MTRILKLKGEGTGITYICAIGEEEGACVIGRYDEDAVVAFLCRPHSEQYEYKSIAEMAITAEDTIEAGEAQEAFGVLEVYGNLETNQPELNDAFEIIWNYIK